MSSFSDRRFWLLEGFGYSTSAQMRSIHNSFNGTVEIDRTTIPGRNCVSISSGGYIDIVNPRYDGLPWADTTMNSGYLQVVQAKVYLDAASYTNLSVNSFLMELWSSTDRRHGFGIGPNTSVNQDNWYIKSYDVATDLSIMTAAYIPPAIPQRTLTDLKFIFYSDGSDDGLVMIYVNNFLVTHTAYNYVDYGDHGSGRRFRGIRLHGLAGQSGPTLWSDLMVYTIPNEFGRHSPRYAVDNILYTNAPYTTTLWGNPFVPMSARVYDITPETTDDATNQFVTIGTGNAITALSGIDTNQYVTSSSPGQAFRLKVGQPDQATGDGSTPITVTDQSEVLAVQYRMYGKDLGGLANQINISMEAEKSELTNYRFRYYKLRASDILRNDNVDGGYLSKVSFLNAAGSRLEYPVGTTMRLNNVNHIVCPDVSFNQVSNTGFHATFLTNSPTYSMHYYYDVFNFSGIRPHYDRGLWVVDWIIDFGVGNIGPDWYRIRINQAGGADRLFTNWSAYGSDDGVTWYALGDVIGQVADNAVNDIINRRHPSYPSNGKTRSFASFNLNASQYEQVSIPYTGDPFCGGNINYEPRTPSTWAQFKNYKIGIDEP